MARWGTAGGKGRTARIALSAVVALGLLVFAGLAQAGTAGAAARATAAGWTSTPLPAPAGAASTSFEPLAISCSAVTQCAAGGRYIDPTLPGVNPQGALLNWSGQQWSAVEAPLPDDQTTGRQSAAVVSMSCPSVTVCFGGGYYENTTGNQPLLLTWSGSAWSAAMAPMPANASSNPDASVSGIACRSATWCMAAGQYDQYGLLLKWSGTSWTPAAAPAPAKTKGTDLFAISCPSTTVCFAAGQYENAASAWRPDILRWSAGKWAPVAVPLPAGAAANPQAILRGIACPSATRCVAAGSYYDSRGHQQGVLLSWSGTKWTAAKPPLPANAGSYPGPDLFAVACPGTSKCTAVGTYRTATKWAGLILTWSGKGWTAGSAPGRAYQLVSISCPAVTDCVAVDSGRLALTGP
ncbi:MAG: hypothetical protein ACM32E_17705 [Gemmatimonadota bacterium]